MAEEPEGDSRRSTKAEDQTTDANFHDVDADVTGTDTRPPTGPRPSDVPYEIELKDIEPPTPENQTTKHDEEHDLDKDGIDPDAEHGIRLCGLDLQMSTYIIRTGLCLLAVALLWLTSLNLSSTLVDLAVPAPTTDYVIQTWRTTIDITLSEQSTYDQCAQRQLNSCNTVLNRTLQALEAQSAKATKFNSDQVYYAQVKAINCKTTYLDVVYGINNYTKSSGNQYTFNSSCTTDGKIICEIASHSLRFRSWRAEQNQVKLLLTDYSQQSSDAYVLNKQYARTNAIFAANAYSSAVNWTAYNRDYLHNKTRWLQNLMFTIGNFSVPAIDNIVGKVDVTNPLGDLIACIGISAGYTCSLGVTLPELYDQAMKAMSDALASMQDSANKLKNYAQTYANKVAAVMSQIVSFFNYLYSISSLLPFSTSIIPGTYIPDLQTVNVPGLTVPTPFTDLWAQVQAAIGTFNAEFLGVIDDVHLAAVSFSVGIQADLAPVPRILTDYNPPPVELLAKKNQDSVNDNNNAFLSQSAVALAQFKEVPQPDKPNGNRFNTSLIFAPNLDFRSPIDLHYEPFSGSFHVDPILTVIYFVAGLFLAADYVWRVTASVRVVVQYWQNSYVGLPLVDVRTKKEPKAAERTSLTVARVLTHPITIVFTWIIIGLVILSAFASLYGPMYKSYVNGCVESDSGTLITNNTYSTVFNYAASKGDKEMAQGISKYDANRADYCGANVQATQKQMSDDQQQINAAATTQKSARDNMALIQKCVILSYPPAQQYYVESGGYQLPSVLFNISKAYCPQAAIAPFMTLQNAAFNCSDLPICAPTCGGPNKDLLRATTHRSGCAAEWMFHAFVTRFFITIMVFICINLSRMWFLDGLRRYHWRSLTPPTGFTYMGTVSRSGKLSKKVEPNVNKKLDKVIQRWERVGYVLFFLAFIIHIPYIVVLAVVAGPFASTN